VIIESLELFGFERWKRRRGRRMFDFEDPTLFAFLYPGLEGFVFAVVVCLKTWGACKLGVLVGRFGSFLLLFFGH
jgi:hypothetical protein